MPAITIYDDKFDFEVTAPESDTEYRTTYQVFLSRGIACETVYVGDEYEESERENVAAIRECPENGLTWWDHEEGCWLPYDDVVQKAYSDFIAEKEILAPQKKKNEKASSR